MSGVNESILLGNESKLLVQHETCEYIYGLNESVFNSTQNRNHNECRCQCKELDDCSSSKNDYMRNPGAFHCKCNRACKINENLYIKNSLYAKLLIGKLVSKCEDEILNTAKKNII